MRGHAIGLRQELAELLRDELGDVVAQTRQVTANLSAALATKDVTINGVHVDGGASATLRWQAPVVDSTPAA